MKITFRWQFPFAAILIASLLSGCSVGDLMGEDPAATIPAEMVMEPTDEPAPTPTPIPPEPTEQPPVELGGEFQSDEGGFTYRIIPGYTEEVYYGMIVMSAKDAAGEIGPMITLEGGTNEVEMSLDELFDHLITPLTDTEISNKTKTDVNGNNAYEIDIFTITEDGDAAGKMVISAVSPLQYFVLKAVAPPAMLGEVGRYFEAVKTHITFFKPQIDFGGADGDDPANGIHTFTMDDVEPGGFIFHVDTLTGDATLVTEGSILNQSNSHEYVIRMSMPNLDYTVMLFLPFGLSSGWTPMEAFNPEVEVHAPGALLYVAQDTWFADYGDFYVDSFSDGLITISFSFYATVPDDPDSIIEVTGAVKEFNLNQP